MYEMKGGGKRKTRETKVEGGVRGLALCNGVGVRSDTAYAPVEWRPSQLQLTLASSVGE